MTGSRSVHDGVAFGWRVVDLLVALRRKSRVARLGRAYPYVILIPSVAMVGILAYGLIYLFWLSIHAFDPFFLKQGPASLDQYRRISTGTTGIFYREVLIRTLFVSAMVTVGAVALALPVAYFVVRVHARSWRLAALTLILVPFLMGETVRAFGWLLLLGQGGAVRWLLSKLGLDVNLIGSSIGIWIGMMQVMMPVAALVVLPAVRRINPDLERAAQTLGASPLRTWRHVVIPLARPGLVAAAAVVFTLSMTEYAIPGVLGLGRLPFVANAIQSIFFLGNNIYLGSAFSMVLVVVVTVLVILLVRVGRARSSL
jgi:putative spermidine/putrescine transport system permease protein